MPLLSFTLFAQHSSDALRSSLKTASISRHLHGGLLRALLPLFLLITCLGSSAQSNDNSVLLVACQLPPEAPLLRPLESAFNDALKPQNARVKFLSMPEPRALDKLYRNEIDGICGVSKYTQAKLTTDRGILLSTPIATIQTIAVYDPNAIDLDSSALFTDKRYKLGYAETSTSIKAYLKQRAVENITAISNLQQAGIMLKSQRINVLIGLDVMLFNLAFKQDFGRFRYRVIEQQQAYPVIHPKHRDLTDALNLQLKRLVKDRQGPISIDNLDNWMAPEP